jgi:Domain of unknown function (DUF4037)
VTAFVPGRELAKAFYDEVIEPLVGDVPHSAAFLGWGSDVVGFDTVRSTDHGWGPRLQLFVGIDDVAAVRSRIEQGLPDQFHGWPTRFGWDEVPVTDHVTVTTLGAWLERQLGFDPRAGMSTADWLTTPQQLLLEVTGGAVFHDRLGEVEAVRAALAWYPDDVWRWLVGCQWWRIEHEESFVGRAAQVGDELGSRVVAARLARDMMRLCFLLERRYAPYSKWLGSAFAQLESAADVGPGLARMLEAPDFHEREAGWIAAVEALAALHNASGLTEPLDPTVRPFYTRPFLVIEAPRFAAATIETVSDPFLRSLPRIGSIDQVADSTDVLSHGDVARRFAAIYGPAT